MNRFQSFLGSVWNFKNTRTPQHDEVVNNVDARTRLLPAAGRSRAATLALGDASRASSQGVAPLSSDAATLVQQMQTQQLEEDGQRLTTALAEANSQITQGEMMQQLHEAEVQRLRTTLKETNSQGAMHKLQTRELVSELHKLKTQLAASEASAKCQHEARASPSGAASSVQQPKSLRERDLKADMQMLKSKLEATAKIAPELPDLSPQKRYAEWLEVDGFLTGLRAMDDKALRETFKQFADIQKQAENSSKEAPTDDVSDNAANAEAKEKDAAEAETGKGRISKQGLAKMFETKKMTLSKVKLEEFMSRIDTDGNEEIDWLEFRALARSNSQLEMLFKGLPLERVLASSFTRGTAGQTVWSSKDCCVISRARNSSVVMMVGSPPGPPTFLGSVETQRWPCCIS